MLARPLTQSDLDAAPWTGYEHRPNIILIWEITEPCAFITAYDGANLYLEPGDCLATDGHLYEFIDGHKQKFWKLTKAERELYYRQVQP